MYLVTVSIGPVQDFIQAARRTRDLWFGSRILSELSKAAARSLAAHGDLIFPGVSPDGDNRPLEADSKFDVSNVILMQSQVPNLDCDELLVQTQAAVDCRWKQIAEKAAQNAERVPGLLDRELWNRQLYTVIEYFGAWIEFSEERGYGAARARLQRLLGARKATRDFAAYLGVPGLPKSSLDGARESVLRKEGRQRLESEPRFLWLRKALRLKSGEELDVVGLTKRIGRLDANYPSIARIAADPWLRGAKSRCPELLEQLSERAETLFRSTREQYDPVLDSARWPQFAKLFPYDGTIVYRNRLRELYQQESTRQIGLDVRTDPAGYKETEQLLARMEKEVGVPNPYYALLAADGDRMGEFLSSLPLREEHQRASQCLLNFSGHVRGIVEQGKLRSESGGCLIFSGGDDVLAFVPLDRVVRVADELRLRFQKCFQKQFPDRDWFPTLSVGVAVAHMLEDLEFVRGWAIEAERHAKGSREERNALAIHFHTRGGAPMKRRWCWDTNPRERLDALISMYVNDLLPDKAAFDLKRLAKFYHCSPEDGEPDPVISQWQASVGLDAVRLLRRKGKETQRETLREQMTLVVEDYEEPRQVADLADDLILARALSAASRQAGSAGPMAGGVILGPRAEGDDA